MSKYAARLPTGIIARVVAVNDLDMHILEALPPSHAAGSVEKPPLILLLHGFPELAFSWRKVMKPLSQAGYHVVAPDQRGYGQTKPRNGPSTPLYEDDISPYRMMNLTTDIVALVYALGYKSVEAVVGHDFGSPVAGHCALIRPDLFKRVVFMSAPFTGPPPMNVAEVESPVNRLNEALATLDPGRKHYTLYYSSLGADEDMNYPPEGLHAFLRAYFHVKSADWKGNKPHSLLPVSAATIASMPHYYIMPLSASMPQCVAPEAPSSEDIASNSWLPEEDLTIYTEIYSETKFQGGLNWYRCQTDPARWAADLRVFAGKSIEVPARFISGKQDWGTYQIPGALETMRSIAGIQEEDCVLVEGAGHWVQQEKPEEVVQLLLEFLQKK